MNTQFPKRKPNRWSQIDYSTAGAYFLTICAQNRRNIFSLIVGEGSPLPQLTQKGLIVEHFIKTINQKYPHMHPDSYVIMPNHIHLILIVDERNGRGNPSPTVSDAVGWLKYFATKEINALSRTPGKIIFQRSFFDHAIRNGREYEEITAYIAKNPQTWKDDCLWSENGDLAYPSRDGLIF